MSAAPSLQSSPAREVFVVPAGEGESLWFLDNLVTVKTTARTGTPYTVIEATLPAGSATPLHCHAREDEAFYVLEGELLVYANSTEDPPRVAGPGSFVHMPAGVPHALRAKTRARTLLICGARGFVDIVRQAGSPALREGLPVLDGPPDLQRLQRATAANGVALMGPPPAGGEPA